MGCVWPGSYNSFSLRLTHGARKAGRIRRRPATDGTALLFTNRRRAVVLSEWADALDALRSLPLIAAEDCSSSVGGASCSSAANPRGVACPAPDEAARHATPPTNGRR